MNYKLVNATKNDISKLIEYKLKSIFNYAENLSLEEINQINDYVKNNFDFSVDNIIKELNLLRPIYYDIASYGHFGYDNLPWEQIK